MIRVASYCRVSTDKEDQVNSFQSQQAFFREYIRREPDWELYEVYADEGITGTSTKKRTQFNRMIRDAHAGKFQWIITKEISRFSRNILDTIRFTRELKAIGVGVLFLTENINTLQPESEMLMTFMGTIAQEESRRTSIRVKWGQTRQMERGVVFGHSMLGYDLKDGRLTINPEGAELVKLIFQKYTLEKKGTSQICKELQNAGHHTTTGNSSWNPGYILKILKNEKYVGDLIQKKSITPDYLSHAKKRNHGEEALVILQDHHEPIISRDLWELTQLELGKRSTHSEERSGHSNRYGFSGKIKCGECGASFVARRKQLKSGEYIRRWCCYTAVSHGRGSCNVGKQLRDEDAWEMLKTVMQSLEFDREAVIQQVTGLAMQELQGEEGMRLSPEQLERRMHGLQKKKVTMMDAFCSGDITKAEMHTLKDRYDREMEELQARMDAANAYQNTNLEERIRKELDLILSLKTPSDILCKKLLAEITVFQDRYMELRCKHLPQTFLFIG